MRAFLLLSCLLSASVAFGAADESTEQPAPLVDAAHANNDAAAQTLLAAKPGPDVNQRSSDGTTALHWAIYHNDVGLIDRLLTAGANPNARNDYGSTPLALAAVVGNVPVIKKLLKAGADVESANEDGQTALMIVARTSNVEAASVLVSYGAHVNAREQWRGQARCIGQ
jgi:ankyrin repeat protein